jgi:hypothetical protein
LENASLDQCSSKRVLRNPGVPHNTVRDSARLCEINTPQKIINVPRNIARIFVRLLEMLEVKKTEMGRTCGTYGGEERCIQGFSGET